MEFLQERWMAALEPPDEGDGGRGELERDGLSMIDEGFGDRVGGQYRRCDGSSRSAANKLTSRLVVFAGTGSRTMAGPCPIADWDLADRVSFPERSVHLVNIATDTMEHRGTLVVNVDGAGKPDRAAAEASSAILDLAAG